MTSETSPGGVFDGKPGARDGKPDIHVWMTLPEAAATLGVTAPIVTRGIEWGEIESRVTASGSHEALICLPRRAVVEVPPGARKDVYRARRSAPVAWVAAAVLLVAICSATLLALRSATTSQGELQAATSQLHHTADDAATLAGERDRLKEELADAHQIAARAQAELVVDRKMEDTLFKSAIAAKAAAAAQRSTVFADGSQ